MRLSDLEITHRFATVNGIRMHYVEKGTGPLVVLLHGFPENWWSWRYQIDPLVRAGYRVVAPDQRGYNDTDPKSPYDVDTLARDARDLIRAAGAERATVISHDWGGAVAWRLAAMHPEVCERLVVMNCPHPAIMARALTGKPSQMRRSWYMYFFMLPFAPEYLLTRDGGRNVAHMLRAQAIDPSNFGDDEIRPFIDAIRKPGHATAMVNWYRTAMKAGLKQPGTPPHYPVVDCPTLILWALNDKALGYDDLVPGTERYASHLEIRTLDQCGHFLQQEQPDRVNDALLKWLGPASKTTP
jgi:pimeloyl-ACP methyl ester carboxylesterase